MDKHVILEECLQEISFVKSRLSLLEERLLLILKEEVLEAQMKNEAAVTVPEKEQDSVSEEVQFTQAVPLTASEEVKIVPEEKKNLQPNSVEVLEEPEIIQQKEPDSVQEEVIITREEVKLEVSSSIETQVHVKEEVHEVKKIVKEKPRLDARLISALRKAIGLNDRFRFKRELFNNNDQLMFDTIDTLDKMDTLAQAHAYLQENFDWKEDDACVVYFNEMLQRRFYTS